ncbi:hypothetical protein JCM16303_000324 [Sporobolomyces ruberrimus]
MPLSDDEEDGAPLQRFKSASTSIGHSSSSETLPVLTAPASHQEKKPAKPVPKKAANKQLARVQGHSVGLSKGHSAGGLRKSSLLNPNTQTSGEQSKQQVKPTADESQKSLSKAGARRFGSERKAAVYGYS